MSAAPTALCAALALAAAAAAAAAPEAGVDWQLSPEAIEQGCRAELQRSRAAIAAAGELRAVDGALSAMNDALAAHRLLASVATGAAERAASEKCNEALASFRVELAGDPRLYRLAKAALAVARTQPDRQLATLQLEASVRAGAALAAPERARLQAMLQELESLQLAFLRALSEERATVPLSPAEAASLPPALLGPGRDAVPVQMHLFDAFMRSERASDARRRYQRAYYNLGGAANVQRLQRAVALRDAIARLLGFESWAHCQLANKMARTPSRAMALVREVDEALLGKARAELAELAALKEKRGDKSAFAPWDYLYYQARYEEARAVPDELSRAHFPVDEVVPAVLRLEERLFGIKLAPVQQPRPWAPGTIEYAVSDEASGKPVGWLFFDLEPREGKSLRPASFSIREGGARLPIAGIIGNGPEHKPGERARFTHRDLVELLHETGHVLHMLLSTAPYATLNGSNVRADFAEAPSQMMEGFAWEPSILTLLSSPPLPGELAQRLAALRHAQGGVFWTRQAFLATYDMTLHSSGAKADPTALWFKLQDDLTPARVPEGTLPDASFVPVMGGYDAGYYGYLWSKVYAEDIYSAFRAAGVISREIGMKYRREILEPGGGEEPEVLVRRFLGRAVKPEAFYRALGIAH